MRASYDVCVWSFLVLKNNIFYLTGNITTSEVLYQKHLEIFLSIESPDIRAEDVSMIDIGLKNEDYFNVQDMINGAVCFILI